MNLTLRLLHRAGEVESRDQVSWATISAASRSLLAPSEEMRTNMPLCWDCLCSSWTWTLTCSALPCPSVTYFMPSIFHMCRGVSIFLTHPDSSKVLYLLPFHPPSHCIHAQCNQCGQHRKHSREWSCVNEGEDVERVRYGVGGAGKCSRGNACMTRIIEGKKEANEQYKPPTRKGDGTTL